MAIPILLWGAAAALAATGVKKGFDAKSDFDSAEVIGKSAEEKYEKAVEKLEKDKVLTNKYLEKLGKVKAEVFATEFKYVVDFCLRIKDSSRAELKEFKEHISEVELKELAKLAKVGLELETAIGSSVVSGALTGLAAYGSVGMLASASTGTAIATLSGAAAKSATLAWLGGGSLAAGGYGIAGGTLALGGIVLGPALAIGGFIMAGKAEEALTEAISYSNKVDIAVEEISTHLTYLKAIRSNCQEMVNVIDGSVERFKKVKTDNINDKQAIEKMFTMAKSLKKLF